MHIHGGNVEEIARKYGLEEEKIMDFSANINPLGPPSKAIKALKKNLSKIARYPDPEAIKLREELSKYLKINPENIITGNGAVELIHLISRTLRPKKALIVVPTFSEYEFALKGAGCKVQFFPLKSRDDFKLDIEELSKSLKNIDLLFLCNPNNPTGQLINKTDLLKIINVAQKRRVFVIIDEVFMDFVEDEKEETLIQEATKRNNLFIIRSLTKFYALPGIRIGYGIGNKRFLKKLKIHKEYWSVNVLAQIAGIAALKDKEYIKKTKRLIPQEREFLYHKLSKIKGLEPYPSVTNFILCRLTDKMNSKKLQKELIQKNILVRDCSSFRSLNNSYIRIAVRTHQENLSLINSLSNIL
jgi:threonine-phosphate decarboxylase